MAKISAFKGWRYNTGSISNIEDVIVPPYDVITPEEQEGYYNKSPHNYIRINLNNSHGKEKYFSAANFLNMWIGSGILVEESKPAIYILSQSFFVNGKTVERVGCICALTLSDLGDEVLPHEQTIDKHLDDRYNLMESTSANSGQIFMCYDDDKMVLENIHENLKFILKSIGWKNNNEIDDRIRDTLMKVGLEEKANKMPYELSGGEQQRVAIARALITNPKLILADEPTGALDPVTSREVLELFEKLHEEENVAFLLVTHNRDVAYFCERSLELRDGRFIAQHGTDFDMADLSDTRELIIDETGTITLPPDLLLKLGGPGRFDVPDADRDSLKLERVEDEKIEVSSKTVRVLAPTCPACNHDYLDSTDQLCPECGSSRPMIQA